MKFAFTLTEGKSDHRDWLSVCAGAGQVFTKREDSPEERATKLLEKGPPFTSPLFRPEERVPLLNQLRQLGKEKCLAVLKAYLVKSEDDVTVVLLCRLLFVNPKGWKVPGLGEFQPQINEEVAKDFPVFPFAIVNRVPFLLVHGFAGGGRLESGKDCLRLCKDFAIIKEDYSTKDGEKASQNLIQSEMFKKLYVRSGSERRMRESILHEGKLIEKKP